MKTFLFIFLAGYAVRCDDSSYYVIQRLEDPLPTKPAYKVYWNVPTMQCKSKKINFTNLFEKFGILQNDEDNFRGEKVAILYDPGLFPALLKNESSGQFKYRNGGVPQEGDLMKHLEVFKNEIEQSIPDKDFSGIGIIDFESWRPVFRQNFGVLTPYKDVSYEIEKQNHWWWKKTWLQAEAKRRFEQSARAFMQTTLVTAKKMRPKAKWGYYGFPYCFNMASNNMKETCADKVNDENDGTYWLWSESTALYPSIYSTQEMTSSELASLIRGRVKEAGRIANKDTHILPYFWFRYRNGGYFSEKDLKTALHTLYKSNATGFIIWGSSKDVNTVDKCNNLFKYVEETFGPAIAKYTRNSVFEDDYEEAETQTDHTTIYDPDYVWTPPENYTEIIHEIVDEEMKTEKNKTNVNDESMLIDFILHRIANYCVDGKCEHTAETTEGLKMNGSESRSVSVTEDPFKLNKTESDVTEPTTTFNYEEDSIENYIEDIIIEEYSVENSTETIDYDFKDNITYSTTPETTTEGNYSTTPETMTEGNYSTNNTDTIYLNNDIVYINESSLLYEEVSTTDMLNDTYLYTTEMSTHIDNTDTILNEDYSSTTDTIDINYTFDTNSEDTTIVNTNDEILNNETIPSDEEVVNSAEMMNIENDEMDSNDTNIFNTTTVAPVLTNQVMGSASSSSRRPVIFICFVYSITKLLCVIFQTCC